MRFGSLCLTKTQHGLGDVYKRQELCCIKKNGRLVVDPKAIKKAAVLVKYLQRKYDIPDSRVIRHYDVTGKGCPGGYLTDKKWKELRNMLTD